MDFIFVIIFCFGIGTYMRCILEKHEFKRPRSKFIDHIVAAVCFTVGLVYIIVSRIHKISPIILIISSAIILSMIVQCIAVAYGVKKLYKWDKDGNKIYADGSIEKNEGEI